MRKPSNGNVAKNFTEPGKAAVDDFVKDVLARVNNYTILQEACTVSEMTEKGNWGCAPADAGWRLALKNMKTTLQKTDAAQMQAALIANGGDGSAPLNDVAKQKAIADALL